MANLNRTKMAHKTRRISVDGNHNHSNFGQVTSKLPKSTHLFAVLVISISTALAFGFPLSPTPIVDTHYREFALPLPPLASTTPQTQATTHNLPTRSELPELTNQAVATTVPVSTSAAGWYDTTVQTGDNLSLIFDRLGLTTQDLYTVLGSSQDAKALERVFPGQQLKIRLDDAGQLVEIIHQTDKLKGLRIVRQNTTFSAAKYKHAVEKRRTFATASVAGSLYQSALKAGLSPAVIAKMGKIFSWKVDLSHVKLGDTFTVIYEQDYYNGEVVADGAILAAEFVSSKTVYRAIGVRNEKNQLDYFTPEGHSLKQAFTRNPVDFTRISSGFQPNRWHPVLNLKRPHRGVDYAAPSGTPVKASGDGVVQFIGRKGGYGNTIIIDHGRGYTTLYAHLSKFKKGLKRGRRVSQDQVIAYVGRTGVATGPHLHYEFRINGKHQDPMTVALPAEPLNPAYRAKFKQTAAALNHELDQHRKTLLADASN